MTSSFNAFGKSSKAYDNPSVPVWLGKVRAVPVGGSLDGDFLLPGALYAAGTPVQIDGKKLKIFIGFAVTAFSAGDGSTTPNDTITIKAYGAGKQTILPAAGDLIQKVGATFAATGKAGAVVSVAAGATAGAWDVAVAHGALDSISAGDIITFSAATAAGSGKSIAVIPNGYLYNDICLGDIDVTNEMAGASGAVVKFHAEGILINRTPAAAVKGLMAEAVPHVLQVNY